MTSEYDKQLLERERDTIETGNGRRTYMAEAMATPKITSCLGGGFRRARLPLYCLPLRYCMKNPLATGPPPEQIPQWLHPEWASHISYPNATIAKSKQAKKQTLKRNLSTRQPPAIPLLPTRPATLGRIRSCWFAMHIRKLSRVQADEGQAQALSSSVSFCVADRTPIPCSLETQAQGRRGKRCRFLRRRSPDDRRMRMGRK